MTREEIAQILKQLRTDAGLTQLEAATILGRKQQTLASWETAQSQPDANTLFALCEIYGASVDEAFGFNAKKNGLSKEEQKIIDNYRSLNKVGQERIIEYIDDITSSGKYENVTDVMQGEYTAKRKAYIKKHALPFAAAGGDMSNLEEAQRLFDEAEEDGCNGKK